MYGKIKASIIVVCSYYIQVLMDISFHCFQQRRVPPFDVYSLTIAKEPQNILPVHSLSTAYCV